MAKEIVPVTSSPTAERRRDPFASISLWSTLSTSASTELTAAYFQRRATCAALSASMRAIQSASSALSPRASRAMSEMKSRAAAGDIRPLLKPTPRS
jgi:hypothetical protein